MNTNPLVRLLFNRGGIGQSLTREETVERINPIIEKLMRLNFSHNYVIDHCSEQAIADQLAKLQKRARADVGKLAEVVLSAGGAAYNGTELRHETFDLGETDNEMLFELRHREKEFQSTVGNELQVNHHLRTEAVLENVQANSEERLGYLKQVTSRRHRPTAAP